MADATTIPPSVRPKLRVETFRAPAAKWWQAAGYLSLLSLVGLRMYPALLLVVMFLLWRWRHDRYAFVVEAMILFGSFGFIPSQALPIPMSDVGLVIGIFGFLVYRKNKLVRRVALATLAYFVAIFLIASTSLESMSVQIYRLRRYLMIITFFVPLLAFANRAFIWEKFRDTVVLHMLVICGFYVIDSYIIGGFILLPGVTWGGVESTFYSPYISGFMTIPRHYPPGLYWMIPCVIWLNYKQIRLSGWQWVMILLTFYTSRTNSLLFALVGCWVFSRPNIKQTLRYSIVAVIALAGLIVLDASTGRYLRLADNFDQFTSLEVVEDEEDLAEFGTGRMAQIIPKWTLLEDLNRVALGFGFIHPEKTTNPVFQIRNDFYVDVSKADEVATEVEVTQVQTIFDIGLVGLAMQIVYFVGVYFIIRKRRYSRDYLNAIIGISLLGVGGFGGLIFPDGLCLIGTVLGAILCANKKMSIEASTAKNYEKLQPTE